MKASPFQGDPDPQSLSVLGADASAFPVETGTDRACESPRRSSPPAAHRLRPGPPATALEKKRARLPEGAEGNRAHESSGQGQWPGTASPFSYIPPGGRSYVIARRNSRSYIRWPKGHGAGPAGRVVRPTSAAATRCPPADGTAPSPPRRRVRAERPKWALSAHRLYEAHHLGEPPGTHQLGARCPAGTGPGQGRWDMKAMGTVEPAPRSRVAMRRPGCTASFAGRRRSPSSRAVASRSDTVNARP